MARTEGMPLSASGLAQRRILLVGVGN